MPHRGGVVPHAQRRRTRWHSTPAVADRMGPDRFPRRSRHRVLAATRRPRDHRHRQRAGSDRRHALRGLGAQRPGRPARRGLQLLERRPCHAPGPGFRCLVAVRRGRRHRRPLQVRGARRGRRLAGEGRPVGRSARRRPHNAVHRVRLASTSGPTTSGCGTAGRRSSSRSRSASTSCISGSWRKGKTYLELADELVEYVSWQGFTHVELMPVTEHPYERLLGLPRHRLFRPDLPARLARTSSATWSTSCTRPASA